MSDSSAVRRRSGEVLPYGTRAPQQTGGGSSSSARLPRTHSTEDLRKRQVEPPGCAVPDALAPPVLDHSLLARARPQTGARSALSQPGFRSVPGYGSANTQLLNRSKDEDENDDGGKSDSESFSEGDGNPDQAVDAAATRPAQPNAGAAILSAQVQASAAPSDSLFTGVNPIRGDDVRIGAYLASGAFGRVFCGAWNGEPVALKQIDVEHARSNLPLSEEDIAEALQWEVSRLATTSHPNLV